MVGIAVLAALVVVLQLLSSVIKIGTVSITLTLIPIVVGAAFYGPGAGAILGTVFGLVVYINSATGADYGGNMVFLANPFLCAVVCIGKGCPAGAPALSTGSSPGRMPRLAAMPSPFCWLPSPRRS